MKSSRRSKATRSDAVLCAGLSGCGFPGLRAERVCYGKTQADADAAADGIVALVESHEDDFDGRIYSPDDGVRLAMELAKSASKPIVIADTRTIPAPAAIPTPRYVARAGAQQGLRCHRRDLRSGVGQGRACGGVGATVTLDLGGKSGISGDAPYRETFVVEKLSDGKFVASGPIIADATWIWGVGLPAHR